MEISKTEKRSSIFDKLTEAIGWLQIVASSLLIGVGAAVGLYCVFPDRITLFFSIGIVVTSLVFGAIWATKIARKRGTINFISHSSSSEIFGEKKENG